MPKGTKKTYDGTEAPRVGVKSKAKLISRKKVDKDTVTMSDNKSKQSENKAIDVNRAVHRRASKRVVKAKRKLDFVYKNDKMESEKSDSLTSQSLNNNAQVDLAKSKF